ncbi:MAG: glycosyltransferase family 39 protein [Anaerolineae bacterium]|nr:glycosyltransferase family 39 protein [Anaerolineae bacterium]
MLALVVILGVTAWFATRLTRDSLWLDEAWSLWAVEPATPGGALARVVNDVHPPLYFLLLDFWVDAAGDSELAARLPSTLMAALCMALLYRLGADRLSARAGVAAALVFGASSFVAYYARARRGCTCSWRCWRRPQCTLTRAGCGATPRARRWLYIGVTAALLYTHYFGVLAPLTQAAHLLLTRRRRLAAWLFPACAAGAFFLPWLPILLWQTRARPGGLAQALPTTLAEVKSLATLLSGGNGCCSACWRRGRCSRCGAARRAAGSGWRRCGLPSPLR